MRISMIAAMSKDGVIGIDGKIPWHLPADLRRFRELTMGKPIIMGRKTLESIGKPLDGRHNIVLTKQQGYTFPGVHVANYIGEAFRIAEAHNLSEIMVIGGGEIYRKFYDLADRLYITIVEMSAPVKGATTFPATGDSEWSLVNETRFEADAENHYPHTFSVFDRA